MNLKTATITEVFAYLLEQRPLPSGKGGGRFTSTTAPTGNGSG